MNIGIDIDNVISNFNEVLLSEYLIHDKELREKGIINKNAEYIRKGMFDWSEIEEENFYKENIERIARKLDLIEGAKEYINKLHEDGNTIYIITGRDNGEYLEPYTMTKKWLKEKGIVYDNCYSKKVKILTKEFNFLVRHISWWCTGCGRVICSPISCVIIQSHKIEGSFYQFNLFWCKFR